MDVSSQIEDLVHESNLIFIATVERRRAANVRAIEVKDSTVVAKIDEVLRAPAVLGDLTGHRITIELSDPTPIKLGDRAIFFTEDLVHGESIAVQEHGRWPIGPDIKGQKAQISDAIQKLPDRHLQERALGSDAVVVGQVSEITPVASQMVTRYDPKWHAAAIDIESVASGSLSGKKVVVFFPTGARRKWGEAPKFQVGDRGVFFVRKIDIPLLNRSGYVVLDPLDYQPREKLDRIRALIKGTSKGA